MPTTLVDRAMHNLPIFRQRSAIGQMLGWLPDQGRHQAREDLTIYCYHTMVQWWDGNLPAGTGGSEEAVVELARAIAQLGWRVTVYNNCGFVRSFGNVNYVPSWQFNPGTLFHVLILWRSAVLARLPLRSRRTLLWLHDVVPARTLSNEEIANVDSVVFVSEFHRSLATNVPEQKAVVIRNGVTIPDELQQSPKEMKIGKCLYTSAPDRGLECLLQLWPRIHEQVPTAKLYLFYGWETWNYFNKKGKWPAEWKRRIIALMQQPGICNAFPFVAPSELWSHYEDSAVWLYPTEFEETSCISAMKAQIGGALPITTAVAGIRETVQWGTKLAFANIYSNKAAQQRFVASVVLHISKPDVTLRGDMQRWARSSFAWSAVAMRWLQAIEPPN